MEWKLDETQAHFHTAKKPVRQVSVATYHWVCFNKLAVPIETGPVLKASLYHRTFWRGKVLWIVIKFPILFAM